MKNESYAFLSLVCHMLGQMLFVFAVDNVNSSQIKQICQIWLIHFCNRNYRDKLL